MRKSVFLIVLMALSRISFGQLTLDLRGSVPADSIFFSNIMQDQEFQFVRYAPVITIRLNGDLNDWYNLTFYTDKDKKMNQLWLNGNRITIKGVFTGKKLEIDTVTGSTLYYKSIDFRNRFEKLLAQSVDSAAINNFLLEGIKQNLNNPYSIEIARNYLQRNISRKSELQKLLPLLASQDATIRNHLLNPYKKTESILSRTKIEFNKFKFHTPEGKLESLTLSKDKRYLIDMWFVGCAPCIEQHQEIIKSLAAFKNNNIEVIGISVDQDQAQWKKFLDKKKYTWLNVREIDKTKQRLRTDMLIESYPTYFLIDGEGNILYQANAFAEIMKHLKL